MTRILIVETASPGRIRHKLRQILQTGVYAEPEISLLCRPGTLQVFSGLRNVKIYTMKAGRKLRIPRELGLKEFDVLFAFWTGEKEYRWMKLMPLRIKAGATYITAGDGNEFRFTWKAICRHAVFRLMHPLPSDHCDFVMLPAAEEARTGRGYPRGEQILILQSADPIFILNAVERLEDKPIFCNPEYTLFCRNRPKAVEIFRQHPMLNQVLTHSEARGSWKHLRNLRKRKFDAIVLFATGDPSYRKIKLFAFLLGVPLRRILVFNETLDCFFFNWSQCIALVMRGMRARRDLPPGTELMENLRIPISPAIKELCLPKERILVLQSAEPDFIRNALQRLEDKPVFSNPEYTLFCRNRPEAVKIFRQHPMLHQVLTHSETRESWKHLRNLRKRKFDAIVLFATGDRSYRKMKLFALLLGIPLRRILVFNDTLDCFFFNWNHWFALVSHRMKHRPGSGIRAGIAESPHTPNSAAIKGACLPNERILVLQSAEPDFILNALQRLEGKPVFSNPEYTLFCRNCPETVKIFRRHPMLHQVLTHSETRGSWKHLRNLRKRKFDAIVLFMTGNPSYRKMKFFAFLLGVPLGRILIFNETLDCFFFNWNQWLALVSHRMKERPGSGVRTGSLHHLATPLSSVTKLVLFPFRFLWLLLVWARLRLFGIKSSRKNHDYSLQLPPFPGA